MHACLNLEVFHVKFFCEIKSLKKQLVEETVVVGLSAEAVSSLGFPWMNHAFQKEVAQRASTDRQADSHNQ